MVEYTFDDQQMQGDVLSETSRQLLEEIKRYLQGSAWLVSPGTAGHAVGGEAQTDMADLAGCLEQAAAQLESLLHDLSRLRLIGVSQAATDEDADAQTDRERLSQAVGEASETDEPAWSFGVTLDQFDRLDTLVMGIKAFGDAVHADGSAEFSAGTVCTLGQTIFDRAVEVHDLLMEIETQALPASAHRRWSVEEAAPAYGLTPARRAGKVMRVEEPPCVYLSCMSQPDLLRLH
ncbi:XAC0095 family protein [Pseudoxanthomonas composti]|uniref:Uncharacterized protein n=1 Tax=Pseudoxanthomonas composti TaxID=2137479 RepID=A0A4Q1JSU3_9GAMM|nr:hypothetical protein [Pseudoxanthomonas composti]RXR02001.1 hypothetical protein EPA99_15175 [Pseudoxanthomonas composti]